ncbi:MAG: LCP family protein [Candidatus Magasanikbacteria bacterium]|nr:LCP family protein [Candidatus Magasanikbacteria bacterium]
MQRTDINFVLQGEDQESNQQEPGKKRSKFFLFLIVFVLLLLGGYTARAITSNSSNNPDDYDPITLEPVRPEGIFQRLKYFVFNKEVKLEGEKDDRINILLLGMGGLGHDGPFLTDTIIIASIKPSTGEVAMISIPRDLGVYIKGEGWWKINHANHFGEKQKSNQGGAFATEVISDTFNIDIPYYIRVDFKAFEKIVDDVGGVNVFVENAFKDSQYPAEDDLYKTISFAQGEQEMNGETALEYSRSRHGNNGEGSDFARARRQQQVILALKEKVFSFSTLANPLKIYNIIKTLDRHITTNMEFADIVTFMKVIKEDLDTKNIKTFVLDNSPNGYLKNIVGANGAYMLQPKTGDFGEINYLIANIFEAQPQKPQIVAEQNSPKYYSDAKIEIQNGTWIAGMAARLENKLEKKGFDVGELGNTAERPQQLSGIYIIGSDQKTDTAKALKEELGISIRKLPNNLTFTSSSDILIILGTDFEL